MKVIQDVASQVNNQVSSICNVQCLELLQAGKCVVRDRLYLIIGNQEIVQLLHILERLVVQRHDAVGFQVQQSQLSTLLQVGNVI